MALPAESYFRMNTVHDLLLPCPICKRNADAENGHLVCIACENGEPFEEVLPEVEPDA